jgi:hypothetical protein
MATTFVAHVKQVHFALCSWGDVNPDKSRASVLFLCLNVHKQG